MNESEFMWNLLEEKLLSCQYLIKQSMLPLDINSPDFSAKKETIKRHTYITALVADLGILCNVLNKPCCSVVKTTLTLPESNFLLKKIRKGLRNDFQHADERVEEFFRGKHNRPIQKNIVVQNNEWVLVVDFQETYSLNQIIVVLKKIYVEFLNHNPVAHYKDLPDEFRKEMIDQDVLFFDSL